MLLLNASRYRKFLRTRQRTSYERLGNTYPRATLSSSLLDYLTTTVEISASGLEFLDIYKKQCYIYPGSKSLKSTIFQFDRSPVHIAAERGHTHIVDLLLDKFKASLSARTKDGSTLMHIASTFGHPETAMAFLKKGVPLNMPNKVCIRL